MSWLYIIFMTLSARINGTHLEKYLGALQEKFDE